MAELWWGSGGLDAAGLGALFLHFLLLSLLAVGGAITTAPDMQRYVVGERGWLTDAQFTASIALAQAAPGPNVLFVAVVGWNIAGLAGVVAALAGSLLPSTTLTMLVARSRERHARSVALRAFTAGLAPLTLGLLAATGWVLLEPVRGTWQAPLLVLATIGYMLKTRRNPLWAIAVGAACGALGWV